MPLQYDSKFDVLNQEMILVKKSLGFVLIFFLTISLVGCAVVRSNQGGEVGKATGEMEPPQVEDPLAGVNVEELDREQLTDKLHDIRDRLMETARSSRRAWEKANEQRKQIRQLQDQLARYREGDIKGSGPQTARELEQQNKRLKEELSGLESAQTRRLGGIVIVTLGERILFDLGKAKLKDRAKPTLNKIADVIQQYPNRRVVVEGHADTQPITTTRYPSNWHLSAARGVSVIRYLVERSHMDPAQFTASGFGEYHPIAPNNTAANRQLNRRVEIVLYPPVLPTKKAQR